MSNANYNIPDLKFISTLRHQQSQTAKLIVLMKNKSQKPYLKIFFFAALVAFFSNFKPTYAESRQLNLVTPINDVGILEPQDPPLPGGPKIYSSTGPQPNWSIAQWNIPGKKLPKFTETTSSKEKIFYTESKESSVKLYKNKTINEIVLAQNGTILPCTNSNSQPRESDLLIGANSNGAKPPQVIGMPLDHAHQNPPLSEYSRIIFAGEVEVQQGLTKSEKHCGINQGGALVAFVLDDPYSQPKQTLFYKTSLSQMCNSGTLARLKPCSQLRSTPLFYWRNNPYGVDDYLPLLGHPFLGNGNPAYLQFDVLPRLKEVIEQGPKGIDRNLSHWSIDNFYVGQHIWGDVKLMSTWSNFKILAYDN